jgi:hypothetical protein
VGAGPARGSDVRSSGPAALPGVPALPHGQRRPSASPTSGAHPTYMTSSYPTYMTSVLGQPIIEFHCAKPTRWGESDSLCPRQFKGVGPRPSGPTPESPGHRWGGTYTSSRTTSYQGTWCATETAARSAPWYALNERLGSHKYAGGSCGPMTRARCRPFRVSMPKLPLHPMSRGMLRHVAAAGAHHAHAVRIPG